MNLDSRIVWRLVRFEDGPAAIGGRFGAGHGRDEGWLTASERQTLAALRDPGRRRGWLQARLLAKQLVMEHAGRTIGSFEEIEIVSRDGFGRGIRPLVTAGGRTMPWSLSISHTETATLVALGTDPALSVGVDLVPVQMPTRGFVRTWFDGPERQMIAAGQSHEPLRIWAVKEAVYKAANRDDPFAPRQVLVRWAPADGFTCIYRGARLAGHCRIDTWLSGDHVFAVAGLEHAAPAGGPNSNLSNSLGEDIHD